MTGWTLIEAHPTHGRTFRRPLDPPEAAFLLLGRNNGNGDILHHVKLRLLNASHDARLFSKNNIIKSWLSTKRRFPLAGATIQVLSDAPADTTNSRSEGCGDDEFPTFTSEFRFVVREHDLAVLHPSEVVFGQITCTEEVPQRMAAILDGPRAISDDLLVRLYVFRETGSNSQTPEVLHLVMLMAHYVTDGTSRRTLMRCLLNTLAKGEEPDPGDGQISLEERLAKAVPSADLAPLHLRLLSPARRRWRGAIAAVIVQLRTERSKGGHTLPTRTYACMIARSGYASALLTQEQTTSALANCRSHGITFGNAYLTLAQVGMTRVLYRRYLRGEISEEEWAYRKMQPYRIYGPFNLRPYLDKEWYEGGGGGELKFCVGGYNYQLPFMTLGESGSRQYRERELSDGVPSFSDLLTFNRFLYRARLVKKQAKAFFNHPLFFEIVRAQRLSAARLAALQWTKRVGTHPKDGEIPSVTDTPVVIAHNWGTMGDVDLILPTEYPLPPTHPLSPLSPVSHPAKAGYASPPSNPVADTDASHNIVVESATSRPNVALGKLYLSALSSRGQLEMHCFYDSSTYEKGLVEEWLDEVRQAVLWYLGQTRHDQHHDGSVPLGSRV